MPDLDLKAKKIIAREGLIFIGLHVVSWIIAFRSHELEWVPKIMIPYVVIRFSVWAIMTLRQKV